MKRGVDIPAVSDYELMCRKVKRGTGKKKIKRTGLADREESRKPSHPDTVLLKQ